MIEPSCDRRLACRLIDTMADALQINIATFAIGPNAEGGWRLEAWSEDADERWNAEGNALYEAACALAGMLNFDMEDG